MGLHSREDGRCWIGRRTLLRSVAAIGGVAGGLGGGTVGLSSATGAPSRAAPETPALGTSQALISPAQFAHTATLPNPEPDADDRFGRAVAVSEDGTTAIVGAWRDNNDETNDVGEAYVFTRSDGDWSHTATLANPEPDADDRFGRAVAVNGDGTIALVGAQRDTVDTMEFVGEAYVFTRSDSDWSHTATLSDPDPNTDDTFGGAVAVNGDGTIALVGAWATAVDTTERVGEAYVFTRSGNDWSHTATLTNPDPDANDTFGFSVAVSGDGTTAIVGAQGDREGRRGAAGKAYVFARSDGNWSRTATFTPPSPNIIFNDRFGWAVAMSGDGATAVVGAPGTSFGAAMRVGEAYVFTRSDGDWSHTGTLPNPESDRGSINDRFGRAVAVSEDGTTAVVGALRDDNSGENNVGEAYVFMRSDGDWSHTATLANPEPDADDRFGRAVAVNGDGTTTAVGAPGDTVDGEEEAGEAYVFTAGGTARVRAAHLVPDAPAVNVYVNGTEVLSSVEFRDISQYLSVPVGTSTVRITPAGDPNTTIFEGDVTLKAGRMTLAAVGELGEDSLSVETLADESGLSDPSTALIRIVHASPDAPPVTVSANGSALAEDLGFKAATEYAEVSPGEYEIAVGPASDPSQSVATFDLSIDGCSVYTVFAAGYLTPDDEPTDEPFGAVTALDASGLEADYATQLSGANEVPPVDTDAGGRAVFDLRGDGQVLRYEVAATGLENTLQGHIHAGGPDENGPVVASLYDFAPLDATAEEARTLEGTLGNANITADDLVGPLEGESLNALIDLIDSGEAYVNLHTVANPSGEIRGQLGTERVS